MHAFPSIFPAILTGKILLMDEDINFVYVAADSYAQLSFRIQLFPGHSSVDVLNASFSIIPRDYCAKS